MEVEVTTKGEGVEEDPRRARSRRGNTDVATALKKQSGPQMIQYSSVGRVVEKCLELWVGVIVAKLSLEKFHLRRG